jgi:RNA-directed DNA polymerase
MGRNWTHLPFERYADDIIIHCRTEREASLVRVRIAARLKQCGLEQHPEKTKVVYCKDANRQESHLNEKFDFLGYTFRPRRAYGRAPAHNDLAYLLASQGRSSEAQYHFEEAIRIDPNYWAAHLNYTRLLAATGRRQQALDHFRKIHQLAVP